MNQRLSDPRPLPSDWPPSMTLATMGSIDLLAVDAARRCHLPRARVPSRCRRWSSPGSACRAADSRSPGTFVLRTPVFALGAAPAGSCDSRPGATPPQLGRRRPISGITPTLKRIQRPAPAPTPNQPRLQVETAAEARRPEHVEREETAPKLTITPTTGAVMPASGAVNFSCPCVLSMNVRRSRMKPNEAGSGRRWPPRPPRRRPRTGPRGPNSARLVQRRRSRRRRPP